MYLPAVTGTGKGSTMDDSADGRGKTAKARMGIKWDKERGEERRWREEEEGEQSEEE
jgi:hypothetical protein